MEKIKPLYIPKSKKWKGLTAFCYKCKSNVTEICKKSGKHISLCKNGQNHVYKVYVYVKGEKNQRKTKSLETRDINEAIKQAIEFENEIKGQIKAEKKVEKKQTLTNELKNQPVFLVNAMAKYISWLNNEGVPAHRVKERSKDYIRDIKNAFIEFSHCLKENKFKLPTVTIDDINDDMVGLLFEQMEKSGMANRTFNKKIGYYTSFIEWFKEQYNYQGRNYFETVSRKIVIQNPEAISQKEYEALLLQITPENGVNTNEKVARKNLYRPWLKDGIRLALETGRRREEIINLKWNNINENDGIEYIKVEDYKVNHIQKRVTEQEKKYIYIPVTETLNELLYELEYEKFKGSDRYILAPEINIQRYRFMSDSLSRGFTHFYDQLNTGRKLTFKSLRKAYITKLEIFMGSGNTKAITGHSDDQVIERNYIDQKEMAKAAKNFAVFPQKNEKNSTLIEIRNRHKTQAKEKDFER